MRRKFRQPVDIMVGRHGLLISAAFEEEECVCMCSLLLSYAVYISGGCMLRVKKREKRRKGSGKGGRKEKKKVGGKKRGLYPSVLGSDNASLPWYRS